MNGKSNPAAEISPIIERVAAECGVEIADLNLLPGRRLRVVIDRDAGPITIELCQRVNHAVRDGLADASLDVDDYHIEIMSPGVNRRLTRAKDYERFRGERVKVTLRAPVDGQRNFTGELLAHEHDMVRVRPLDTDHPREFRMADVREVRLAPDPKELGKKRKKS